MPEEKRYKAYIPAFDQWIEHGSCEYTPPEYKITYGPTSEEIKESWEKVWAEPCKEDWEYGSNVEFLWTPRGYVLSCRGQTWCRWIGRTEPSERPPLTDDEKKWAQFCAMVIINDLAPYYNKDGNTEDTIFRIPNKVTTFVSRLCFDGKITRTEMKQFFKEYDTCDDKTLVDLPAMKKCLYYAMGMEPPKEDVNELTAIVKDVLATVPFKGAEENRINFYIGQVMKKVKGKFNAQEIRKALDSV
jgi:hypothetical protein